MQGSEGERDDEWFFKHLDDCTVGLLEALLHREVWIGSRTEGGPTSQLM